LSRYQKGAATVADFCADEGVSVAAFYAWRRRLLPRAARRESFAATEDSSPPPLFVPISVTPAATELRIDVADSVVVRVPLEVDERQLIVCLRAVLAATRSREGR
jgi:hypothetical protein